MLFNSCENMLGYLPLACPGFFLLAGGIANAVIAMLTISELSEFIYFQF